MSMTTYIIDYAAIQNRDPEDRADSITIGLASSILSNRVSHFLNVNGPRYVDNCWVRVRVS